MSNSFEETNVLLGPQLALAAKNRVTSHNDRFFGICKQNQNSGLSKAKPILSVKGLIAEAASAHQRIIVVLLG